MSILNRVPSQRAIRHAYDLWSHVYDAVAAPSEAGVRMQALEALPAGSVVRVLDVGVGSGSFLTEIGQRCSARSFVCGLDVSAGMLRRARERLRSAWIRRHGLLQGDALRLPFRDEQFDFVVSTYVLDLMPVEAIGNALCEFRRVLRPGGRAILVNLTKLNPDRTTWYERCYRALPPPAQAYLLGGCRPVCLVDLVRAAGFTDARRTVVRQALSSEIVLASKADRNHTSMAA